MVESSSSTIAAKYATARARLDEAQFTMMHVVAAMSAEWECRAFLLPAKQAQPKAADRMADWHYDLRVKSCIEEFSLRDPSLPKPQFNAYQATDEEFLDVLIVRCAYFTAGCFDHEVVNLPAVIARFLKDAYEHQTLVGLRQAYNLFEVSVVAIAANFWRFHNCGRPIEFLVHPKHVPLPNPEHFDSDSVCRLCREVVPNAQQAHLETHSFTMLFVSGSYKCGQPAPIKWPRVVSQAMNHLTSAWCDGPKVQMVIVLRDLMFLQSDKMRNDPEWYASALRNHHMIKLWAEGNMFNDKTLYDFPMHTSGDANTAAASSI